MSDSKEIVTLRDIYNEVREASAGVRDVQKDVAYLRERTNDQQAWNDKQTKENARLWVAINAMRSRLYTWGGGLAVIVFFVSAFGSYLLS